METEASKFINEDDIAVIKTDDEYSYCLLKLLKDPFEAESPLDRISTTSPRCAG